ncbi:MAG TPA: hypothetical protein DCY20_00710 [Firmicutes bacterium]|nr:hypothetical protein [Bacillota bacterium]
MKENEAFGNNSVEERGVVMEKLEYVYANGNDYFFAHHGDEIHFFQVGKDKWLGFDKFESASLMDDTFWKSGNRFEKNAPIQAYFNDESVIVAVLDENGFNVLDQDLYQKRKEFYDKQNALL